MALLVYIFPDKLWLRAVFTFWKHFGEVGQVYSAVCVGEARLPFHLLAFMLSLYGAMLYDRWL